MQANNNYDAVIIGGGPAGCTAATVLAQKGRRVLVLEREKFPRYHVGESMMPYCYFPLERIGLIDKIKQYGFTQKYSVQFVRMDGRGSQPFYFFQHLEHEAATTWQILRSEFDDMLMQNAREKGAEVREEMNVRDVIREDGRVVGVCALDKDKQMHEFRAPVTIDASGRNAFLSTQNRWRVRDPYLNKIAIWTYYKGAKRDSGYDEGATTIAYLPEKSWFWYIPLHEDRVSVGVVAEKDYLYKDTRDIGEIFQREVKKNKWIEQHLAEGEQYGEYFVTGEFSYRSQYCAEDGAVLAGDAFAFLDPVFSSGLYLALRSGEMVADAVDAALTEGNVSAAHFEEYSREFRHGLEAMRKLVYAFYDHDFSFAKLHRAHPDIRGDLTDCLIGYLSRDFTNLFNAISEFAQLPEPLPHGEPFIKDSATEAHGKPRNA